MKPQNAQNTQKKTCFRQRHCTKSYRLKADDCRRIFCIQAHTHISLTLCEPLRW